jgi:tRNA(Met) cytidine acetyltransferase
MPLPIFKDFWNAFERMQSLSHRQGLCLQGSANTSYSLLIHLLQTLVQDPPDHIDSPLTHTSSFLYLGSKRQEKLFKRISITHHFELPPFLSFAWKNTRQQLGSDESLLIIDLYEGIHPDALASLLGCVQAGGLIIVLMPIKAPQHSSLLDSLKIWPTDTKEIKNRYWQRLWHTFSPTYWYILRYESENTYWQKLPTMNISDRLYNDHIIRSIDPKGESVTSNNINASTSSNAHVSTKSKIPLAMSPHIHHLVKSEAQQYVIEQMLTSQQRQAFSAVVVTAHRGRGKSAALGLGVVALLVSGVREIHITSAYPQATQALFRHALIALDQLQIDYQTQDLLSIIGNTYPSTSSRTQYSGSQVHLKETCNSHDHMESSTPQHKSISPCITSVLGRIEWVSPRDLWQGNVRPHTLCVDEAAALPLPLLQRLVIHKPKLIFATTIHGYEGTGRGFSLRFRPFLQKKLKKLYEIHMQEPIRWSQYDPIEKWSYQSLLLDLQLPMHPLKIEIADCIYHKWDRDHLVQQEDQLRQIFALLLNAHYRTQPSDLWRILDASNLSIHTLSQQGQIVSAAVLSREGSLNAQQAALLYEGSIRPRGQLLAANLSIHLNDEMSACLGLARIVRIATLPRVQSKRLGTHLLHHIKQWACDQKVDLLCSSFGVQERLIHFWSHSHFVPLRLAVRASQITGEHSLLVAQALSEAGHVALQRIQPHIYNEFLAQCSSSLQFINPQMILQLLPLLLDHTRQEVFDKQFLNKQSLNKQSLNKQSLNKQSLNKQSLNKQSRDSSLINHSLSLSLLTRYEWQKLASVIYAGRPYELIISSAYLLLTHALYDNAHQYQKKMNLHDQKSHDQKSSIYRQLSIPLQDLLIMKVLQSRGWMSICHHMQLSSPSVVMKGLNAALAHLFQAYAPQEIKQWATRFPRSTQSFKLDSRLQK